MTSRRRDARSRAPAQASPMRRLRTWASGGAITVRRPRAETLVARLPGEKA